MDLGDVDLELEDAVQMDRAVPEVVAPPVLPLSFERCFDKQGMPNLPVITAHLQREGRIEDRAVHKLIKDAHDIFNKENNILQVKYPVTVCGDIHGQFFDLMRLLELGGDPADNQYLFLGDYVDRGCFSSEVVLMLYALKITYPKTMHMLRGNHECRQLTAFFNFRDECIYKYSEGVYDVIMDSFDALPICAIVENTFFCVHGGLSPDVQALDQIKQIDRKRETPREGAMCDLLWSDPFDEVEEGENDALGSGVAKRAGPSTDPRNWFTENTTRQCSFTYGVEAVRQFLKDNRLTSIIRAHEAQVDGYKMHMLNSSSGIPRVITIFSAPNYCDVYKNKAAVLKFDKNVLNIKQFVDCPHPYYLPNFMDVFQWSLPFVAEKVTEMLASIINAEIGDDDEEMSGEENIKTKHSLKQKVVAVTKVIRMYKMLRQNNDAIVSLKQLTPNHKVPMGLLTAGKPAIMRALKDFSSAQQFDKANEAFPPADSPRLSKP